MNEDQAVKDANAEEDKDIIQAAVNFLHSSQEASAENRRMYLNARKFRAGQQWPPEIQQSRLLEQRPCLTINKLDAYCLQVCNNERQQRPRIKVDPTGNAATKKKADVIKGLIRHIESTRNGAQVAYTTGFDSTITGGWGYWRILADYLDDNSFDQELYLAPIENTLSCYDDPNDTSLDGSGQEEFLIADDIPKAEFAKLYPDANTGQNFTAQGTGDGTADWITKDNIRVAEYFRIKRTEDTLYQLSDGSSAWGGEIGKVEDLQFLAKRKVMRRKVQWFKVTASDVLERRDLKGKYIPIVKMTGKVEIIDGKRLLSGLVKNAMDPQRAFNFWRTAMTETVALAPKAKWLIAEGQDEGHEGEWAQANTSAKATLRYKPTDVAGNPAPPPQRLQPEPPPEGAMVMANSVGDDLTSVLGIVDPAMRIGGNVSGKALQSERLQSDNSTFHYYDNETISIAQTGRILLDLIPYYYSGPRTVRIIGDDGQSTLQAINDIDEHDITVGAYDVVMDTGPGYSTKRQEAVDSMMPLMQSNEDLFKVTGDLLFRNMDFPGAEVIADRLAAANPLAQIDDQSEIPPQVQMQLQQTQATIKQLQEALQSAEMEKKYRLDVESVRQDGENRRALMESQTKIHNNDNDNAAWMHDVAVKSQTSLSVAEINAVRDLLKTRTTNQHEVEQMERASNREDMQLKQKQDADLQ